VFTVQRAPPFQAQLDALQRKHRGLERDVDWLRGRLEQAPDAIGDRVRQIRAAFPVFKTRCKDSCCDLSAREGWRVYYAIDKKAQKVWLLFLIHKKEAENPGKDFLKQKIERAFGGAS
jgi:hypothetical protein